MTSKRQALIDTSLSLFIERGFHDTPTSLIARQAQVATGTLFYHFKDKTALIDEIYLTILRDLAAALQIGLATEDGPARNIEHMWFNEVRWGLEHTREIRFVQQFTNSSFVSRLTRNDANAHLAFAKDLFAEALETRDIVAPSAQYALDLYVSNTLMNIGYFHRHSSEHTPERLEEAFRIFWWGLAANAPPP